ncbi:hypothetical protein CC1G_05748 [Coprinopsis cinerea okayama7|uniref:(4-O-methyl)-D-glucuronate--lignin esterase n=1 Tax=Coprinopsis cinerea (strain Okayama-7 / 130 / ATCC MYA-4618 / FGSC 9003) TaxID=240176 RepID=A8NA21_COPC7|nr:hypothetical protein CC1G_05748 [Coprinopsis cinerea okayama7\|eukprot:XP_001831677.2 hypothetical protein CC1G_05748 [Coprinopsis cinerea okayama7\
MSVLVLAPARWARLREVQGRRDDGIANSNHPWDHRWSRPPPSSLSSSSLLIARRVGDSREFVSHHPRDLADVICSGWYSHAALLASALDHRFLFTIIRDSEAYASGCWRTAEAEQQTGTPVLTTLTSQLWENSYVLDNYPYSLRAFIGKTDTLPYDHHLLTALVAPRPLVVLETSKSFWLGQSSALMKPTGLVPSGLRRTNMRPFYEKYFYGRDVKTGRFETELEVITLDEEDWIQWETPVLVD